MRATRKSTRSRGRTLPLLQLRSRSRTVPASRRRSPVSVRRRPTSTSRRPARPPTKSATSPVARPDRPRVRGRGRGRLPRPRHLRARPEHGGDARVRERRDVDRRHDASDDDSGVESPIARSAASTSGAASGARRCASRGRRRRRLPAARLPAIDCRGLAQPDVDDLHPGVAQDARHHLHARGRGRRDPTLASTTRDRAVRSRRRRSGTGGSVQVPNTDSSASVTSPTVTYARGRLEQRRHQVDDGSAASLGTRRAHAVATAASSRAA